jgi:Tol biopolymer transport system component
VAFSWNGEKQDNYDIYVKVLGSEPHFRLTTDRARDYSPTWSPDGRWIAFCRELSGAKVAVWLISPIGGPERKITETNSADPVGGYGSLVTWSPDSHSLVISDSDGEAKPPGLFLLSVDTGKKRRLTSPSIGDGDRDPAFSPDGHTLAFSRYGDLCLLDLSDDFKPLAEPKRLTSGTAFSSPVWTPDGKELVFYTPLGMGSGLWRMPVLKPAKPQRLPFASNQAHRPAVSRQGKRLAYAVNRNDYNIWRVDLLGPDRKVGNPARLISSTQGESTPAYSPDGKKIAFQSDRSGDSEIWVCDKDGSNQVKLTSIGAGGGFVVGPQWSPDNQSIAFWAGPGGSLDNFDIYVVDGNGGAPKRMTTDPAADSWPNWSRDGQWLYFAKGGEIWKMPFKGGKEIQVSRDNGADWPHESPDGKWLYYTKGWPGPQSVWRMPVAGGEAIKVLDAVNFGWTVGKDGIYFSTVADEKRHADLSVYEFATGKTRKIRTMERPGGEITVSPDCPTILYTQLDEEASDLMLVENFR